MFFLSYRQSAVTDQNGAMHCIVNRTIGNKISVGRYVDVERNGEGWWYMD
jgi:hypothetical protein